MATLSYQAFILVADQRGDSAEKPPGWKAPRSQSLATTRKLLPIRAGGTIDRREAENPAEEVVGEAD